MQGPQVPGTGTGRYQGYYLSCMYMVMSRIPSQPKTSAAQASQGRLEPRPHQSLITSSHHLIINHLPAKMMSKKLCVFVEWAIFSALWIPVVIAASSSKSAGLLAHLPDSICQDGNKNEDEDESSYLPNIFGLCVGPSSRSRKNVRNVKNSATLVTSTSTKTDSVTSPGMRIGDPQLPHFSWDDPGEDIETTGVNETTFFPGEQHESLQTPRQQQATFDDDDDIGASLDFHPKEEALAQSETFGHSSVVYRYFGRSRARARSCDSIPFILFGPSVDHWKTAGQTLASRGFSVMACERGQHDDGEESALIVAILDALRWPRAILVGCDKESSLAIKAAMELAPERVAGLVLCGDLSSAEAMLSRPINEGVSFALDQFLLENLECPFTIIWDGDLPRRRAARSNIHEVGTAQRCLILGGGSAPHRRQPEHFAWTLTRFVEEKVDPPVLVAHRSRPSEVGTETESKNFALPFGWDGFIAPGSLLVAGRIIANALLLASFGKIFVYQFENFQHGIVLFQSRAKLVHSWPRRILFSVIAFVFRRNEPITTESEDAAVLPTTKEESEPVDPELSNEENSEGQSDSDAQRKAENYHELEEELSGQPMNTISPYQGLMFLDQVIS